MRPDDGLDAFYPIVPDAAWVRRIVPLGVRTVQLRLKDAGPDRIRREIVALAESRRTESYWVRTRIFDADGQRQKAEMLLNHATLKDSYAGYAKDAAPV